MANEPAAEPAPAKGGKKGLIILILLAVFAIGGGAAIPWVLGDHLKDKLAAAPKKAEQPKSKQTAIPFDDVVVNIGEERLNRYLRVKLMLAIEEVDSRDVTELLSKQKAFLKSWLICYLAEQSAQEVSRRAGVNRIRREICEQFNAMLYPGGENKIVDVLFDMFVVN